jgi:hypothetical protein
MGMKCLSTFAQLIFHLVGVLCQLLRQFVVRLELPRRDVDRLSSRSFTFISCVNDALTRLIIPIRTVTLPERH